MSKPSKTRYKILSLQERHSIWILSKSDYGVREIARLINRNPSTVSRELKRGTVKQWIGHGYCRVYDYHYANTDAQFRLSARGRNLKIGSDYKTAQVLKALIEKGYSPYAANEITKKKYPSSTSLTSRTIYNYIHNGTIDVAESCLVYGFRKSKKTESFNDRKNFHTLKSNHISIEQRPKTVLSRVEFGHWEGDTVIGPRGSTNVLFTLCERKTRFLIAILLKNRKQTSIAYALDLVEQMFGKEKFNRTFKTLTLDNGMEFLDVDKLQRSFYPDKRNNNGFGGRLKHIYFAHPYCSSERGSNENVHRFIRRKYPKETGFDKANNETICSLVNWINTYPRLIHKGMSAAEVFSHELKKIS